MVKLRGDWRDLFSGFVLALDVRKQALALAGALLIFLAVGLPTPWLALRYDGSIGADFDERGPASYVLLVPGALRVIFSQPAHVPALWTLGALLVATAVWSLFGVAVSRIAAVEIAREDRMRTAEALSFAWKRWPSSFASLIACSLGFSFFAGLVWLVSVPASIPAAGPWFGLVAAIAWPFLLLGGFVATLIALGTVFGFPLFYPAIAAEGTDAFDAISRGFSYVYSRPWHALWYAFVSLVHGAVSTAFIYGFGIAMLFVTCAPIRLGMGAKFNHVIDFATGQTSYDAVVSAGGIGLGWMAVLMTAWLLLTVGMTLAYALSYMQSQLTMIYFLLRQRVDEMPITYVFEDRGDEEAPAPSAPPPAAPAEAGKEKT
jgi:hypothetical protein